jgi:Nitrile hydratase, alpha chain
MTGFWNIHNGGGETSEPAAPDIPRSINHADTRNREGKRKMSNAEAMSRRDLEAKLVARAWADDGFRERLKADPRAAVTEETGMTVPESIELEVLEETSQKAYLVIPADRVAMSDEELEVASGADPGWAQTTGTTPPDPGSPEYTHWTTGGGN